LFYLTDFVVVCSVENIQTTVCLIFSLLFTTG
jgi:hypothetical protein